MFVALTPTPKMLARGIIACGTYFSWDARHDYWVTVRPNLYMLTWLV